MSENPPAFPVSSIDGFTQHGMDLRDWFAGLALPAVIAATSAGQHSIKGGYFAEESIALDAYALADAMLARRSAS